MIELSSLDPTQRQAVELCCGSSRLCSVTGQAGTGKTTIVKIVVDVLTENGYSVALAAPTGKAAKRISEATGYKAVTIHRLLKFSSPGEVNPETGNRELVPFPRHHREDPLPYDVVIVDEYAMVPTGLHRQLIDALRPAAKLRCFGDVNQLPPIEDDTRESPFRTLLRSSDFPKVVLGTIHRHDTGSAIVQNGMRILRGMVPLVDRDSFAIRLDERPLAALSKLLDGIREKHEGTGLFDNISHQVITPQRVGTLGAFKLNQVMIDLYGKTGTEFCTVEAPLWEVKKGRPARTRFYVGQKVIVTQNIYDLRPTIDERYESNTGLAERWIPTRPDQEVYNGETGLVQSVEGEAITIDVGDRIITIPPYLEYLDQYNVVKSSDPRKHVEHAYAITTHKSQGSEYEGIIYFICATAGYMQCRANFYTAITRAKNQVVVVSDRRSVNMLSLKPLAGFGTKRS